MERRALFKMGGVAFSTELLKKTNVEKVNAASIPQMLPATTTPGVPETAYWPPKRNRPEAAQWK
ncbi:MAG: hypothetical protein KID09_29380 [Paenibacillus macerans]|nr:hypothetical protein [Paenibacillus macerans]